MEKSSSLAGISGPDIGSPCPVTTTSGRRSASFATLSLDWSQSMVKYLGRWKKVAILHYESDGILLIDGYESVPRNQHAILVPKKRNMAWRMTRRMDEPPPGHIRY